MILSSLGFIGRPDGWIIKERGEEKGEGTYASRYTSAYFWQK